jgi:hypothetical protein
MYRSLLELLGFTPTILETFFVGKTFLPVSRITSTYYYMVKVGKINSLGANIFES